MLYKMGPFLLFYYCIGLIKRITEFAYTIYCVRVLTTIIGLFLLIVYSLYVIFN